MARKKGKAKKMEKKVEKVVEKKTRKRKPRATKRGASAMVPSQKLSYKQMNAKPPEKGGPKSPDTDTKEYVTTLLNPWSAYDMGYEPSYPDGSMVSAYRFATKTILSAAGSNTGTSGNYDVTFRISPFGLNHVAFASTYAGGLPTVYTGTNVNGYSSWSTLFDNIRCVALGAVVRNVTTVTNQSGDILQARLPSELCTTTAWSAIASSSDCAIRGLSNPGDMGMLHWRPQSSAVTGDTQFKEYNIDVSGLPTSTSLLFWSQSSTAQTLQIEVYAFWEAHVFPASTALLPMVTKCGDPALANRLLMQCLNTCADFCQDRMVARDDGDFDAFVKDAKNIWGGVQSAWNVGKKVYSWISSLFALPPKDVANHKWVARVMHHFAEDPSVFDLLMSFIRMNPRATLADVLAYFENYHPEPNSPSPSIESKYSEIISPAKIRSASSTR